MPQKWAHVSRLVLPQCLEPEFPPYKKHSKLAKALERVQRRAAMLTARERPRQGFANSNHHHHHNNHNNDDNTNNNYLSCQGWNSHTRREIREIPRKFEAHNLSRDNLSRETGRIGAQPCAGLRSWTWRWHAVANAVLSEAFRGFVLWRACFWSLGRQATLLIWFCVKCLVPPDEHRPLFKSLCHFVCGFFVSVLRCSQFIGWKDSDGGTWSGNVITSSH